MKEPAICSFRPSQNWSLRSKTHTTSLLRWLFFGIVFSQPAAGFALFPEFHGITEERRISVENPDRINSEYSSDYLTFLKPFNWERKFWRHPNAFDLSTGSLSGEEFQIRDRLKLHQDLIPDKLQFRFTYFAERDFEIDQTHQILELIYRFTPQWGISAYGETSFFKAEDDVGGALVFQPNKDSEHRLFHTWIDYSRNKRNREPDYFKDKPANFGAVGRHFHGDWFFQYALTYLPPFQWVFPDDSKLYESQSWKAQFEVQQQLTEISYWGLEIQADENFESEGPINSGTLTPKSLRRKRVLSRTEYQQGLGKYHIRFGSAYFYRDYKINNGRVLFRDVLPFAALGLPDRRYNQWIWQNEIGLETTFHQGEQTQPILAAPPQGDKVEMRFNWLTSFDFRDQGELVLVLTADIDEFGSGRTWEGGNAQFRFWF